MLDNFQLATQQETGYSCLEKFVGHLWLLSKKLDGSINDDLTTWIKENIKNHQDLIGQLEKETKEREEKWNPGLLVGISRSRDNYVVEGWLIKDLDKYNRESSLDCQTLKFNNQVHTPTNANLTNLPEIIKDFIKQSLEKSQKYLKQIHIFLPFSLMNYQVDCCPTLLITGKPGTGKSSLAYAVAKELKLGEVLYWSITTRTTLKDGLYNYDAIARLQRLQEVKQQSKQGELTIEQQQELKTSSIENYITLGPLGTALLPSDKPRVLLIDEIDKSDIDLPNDLLSIFEEGRFKIDELVRLKKQVTTVTVRTAYTTDKNEPIKDGEVICTTFPLVFLTSNGEIENRKSKTLANDQLLNALFMVTKGRVSTKDKLIEQILQDLGQVPEDEE